MWYLSLKLHYKKSFSVKLHSAVNSESSCLNLIFEPRGITVNYNNALYYSQK